MPGKTAWKVSLSHPFCVHHILECNVPRFSQTKHGKNDTSTPFLHVRSSLPVSSQFGIRLHTKLLPNRTLLFSNLFRLFLLCDYRTDLFPEFICPGKNCYVRKVAERKSPEFFEFLSRIFPRISLRIFPELFEEFSCFISWETETWKNSPKIPAIFQCKIPRQIRKDYSQNVSGEEAK